MDHHRGHRSGGTINTVLEAVSESLKELEKIKRSDLQAYIPR